MDKIFLPEAYEFSSHADDIDVKAVHHYLSVESYWAKDIPMETVARSMEHSLCFAIMHSSDRELAAFARVISDQATFAYLCDVFVQEKHRGLGLSKALMAHIHADSRLQGLRRWSLATLDAHGLYTQFGWQLLSKPDRFMEITRPDIYTNQAKD